MSEELPLNSALSKDGWEYLKKYTNARIALGRAGTSLPTQETLSFKLSHAHAKDALFANFNISAIQDSLKQATLPAIVVHSKAPNRTVYLKRPDLGRALETEGWWIDSQEAFDVLIVVADGLSPQAVNEQVGALVVALSNLFQQSNVKVAPIVLAKEARVAIGDAINDEVKAALTIVLIGERPGLSAYNSLGAYLTYNAKSGFTDEKRNCISNIHSKGLSIEQAADKIFSLGMESLRRRISGVALKDKDSKNELLP